MVEAGVLETWILVLLILAGLDIMVLNNLDLGCNDSSPSWLFSSIRPLCLSGSFLSHQARNSHHYCCPVLVPGVACKMTIGGSPLSEERHQFLCLVFISYGAEDELTLQP